MPDDPPPTVETAPLHLYPEGPRIPTEKALINPRSSVQIPLTHNTLFYIFKPPQSEFISIINGVYLQEGRG